LLCRAAESRADESRKRLKTARDDVAQAGVVPTDPQARRLAAILPGISEEAIALYQPIILPASISALGLLLISVGAHQPKPRKVQRRKRRPRPKVRKLPQASRRQGNVVPLRKRA
jgi:hypothetical protein